MVQNSKSKNMCQMKHLSPLQILQLPVRLSPKEKAKQENRKSYHYH